MFTLRNYQENILNDLKDKKAIGLFMGTGTGKTKTSIAKVKQNKTTNLLVIAPSKVLEQWTNELCEEFHNYTIMKFKASDSLDKRNKQIIRPQNIFCKSRPYSNRIKDGMQKPHI